MESKLFIQAARMTRTLQHARTGLPHGVRAQSRVPAERDVSAPHGVAVGATLDSSSPPPMASTVGRHGVLLYPNCYDLGNDVLSHVADAAAAAAALSACQWRAHWNGTNARLACMTEEVVVADALADLEDAATEFAGRCPP